MPGIASSARTPMASRPARKKKMNELTTYRIPIFLWSVVVSHSYRPDPICGGGGCSAVVAIGAPYWTVSVPVMFGCTVQMNV